MKETKRNISDNPTLVLVNTSINSGSTGRIAEEIGLAAQNSGFNIWAAYGRTNNHSLLNTIKIGSQLDFYRHTLKSRLFDRHGFSSEKATKRFIEELRLIKPDIINLHNIHGYYLNLPILFNYLRETNIPVVWTFHDCWPMTGHCSYFDRYECEKWKSECRDCPNLGGYPTSLWIDNSPKNFKEKKELFTTIDNLTIVTPCQWMANIVRNSFLGDKRIEIIYNGVNLEVFKPATKEEIENLRASLGIGNKKIFLGVASIWDNRKGLQDFIRMSSYLNEDELVVLVGLNEKQIASLPHNIKGIKRTENVSQLSSAYSAASAFLNPTYVDNFPTTNIEALACGTPVITYDTGGSPEAVDEITGVIVEKEEYRKMLFEARKLSEMDENTLKSFCRARAIDYFNSTQRFKDYADLFKKLCITTH